MGAESSQHCESAVNYEGETGNVCGAVGAKPDHRFRLLAGEADAPQRRSLYQSLDARVRSLHGRRQHGCIGSAGQKGVYAYVEWPEVHRGRARQPDHT
jgi:hypothetical protein